MKNKRLISILSTILISVFPVLFLYFRNAGEVYLTELVTPLAVYVAVGLVCLIVLCFYTKSIALASICTFPFVLVFENYAIIEVVFSKILPMLKWWHIIPLLIFILVHIAMLLKHFMNEEFAGDIVSVLTLVFAGLIAVNAVTAVPVIVERINNNTNVSKNDQTSLEFAADVSSGPNVYWFLFDEYSNFDVIQKYYGYDNSDFAEYLENKGFAVSYDSVNDSQQTTTIVANYVAMEYLADDTMTTSERVQIRRENNRIFSIMRQDGYQLRGIGDTISEFPMEEEQTVNVSSTIEGDTFSSLLLKKTAVKCFLPEVHSEIIIAINNSAALFEQSDFYQQHGCFTMWYANLPHQPFVFKRDGSENEISKWHDWVDPEAYLGSYIHATNVLKKCVDNIIKNDPNCIIVLQSDHSARSLQDKNGNYLIDKYDRRHCLNAVYYMGEDISEIKGHSGANTWRLIMNRLFNMNFSILEVPISEYEF